MEDYSEEAIRNNCPFCNKSGWAFAEALEESTHFHIICDSHPLTEGHLLIVPKRHVTCIGEYTPEEFKEFQSLYDEMKSWVKKEYGSVATFEHGKIGQTVFHSHVHLMPFVGQPGDIIPEGEDKIHPLSSFKELSDIFKKEGQYLVFSIDENLWTVDPTLGFPRFFRDRFAAALGRPERANWKETRKNPALLAQGQAENTRCQQRFVNSLR